MIEETLKNLVEEKKREGRTNDVIINLLKEALQYYVLDYLFNSSYGKPLIFTGGSALRIGYGLNRLSEDLDFDLERGKKIEKRSLSEDIISYFQKSLAFKKIEASISGQREKIYLKFPILYDLGVAEKPQSDKLYVKVEIEKNISPYYETNFLPISKYNLNFLLQSYTLETLLASKIIAILRRTFRKGKGNRITFKGRDYYDLLWFCQKGIQPDMNRIRDVLKITTQKKLQQKLLEKTNALNPRYLKEDLLPLFVDPRFVERYCKNYQNMIGKYLQ